MFTQCTYLRDVDYFIAFYFYENINSAYSVKNLEISEKKKKNILSLKTLTVIKKKKKEFTSCQTGFG